MRRMEDIDEGRIERVAISAEHAYFVHAVVAREVSGADHIGT